MAQTYGQIAQNWPRLAAAVNEATKGSKDMTSSERRPLVTRRQAEAAAVAIAERPSGREGWTVDQLRRALESEVAS
jgi:hypothetical protein